MLSLLLVLSWSTPLAGMASEDGAPLAPVATLARLANGVAPPVLDGRLDEPAWEGAGLIEDLRQVEPVEGATPSQRTRVLLLHDAEYIYIGLLCDDTDPGAIRATQLQRDADLSPDDRVELVFDPFLDRRNGFWFQIGAGGSRGDALITRNGDFNKQWDTIWDGRVRITDAGWQAELAIPVASIRFDPKGTRWGFNVRRLIRRTSEEARWAAPTQHIRFFSIANAGDLVGIGPLNQGFGLDVKPFVVGDALRDDSLGETNTELDAGLDVFYSFTSSTKLSLSVNTDFAETEVDDRQVNLTRFPLFFPEKRDFFLEDAGVFSFGPNRHRDVIPFFSRRIGLDSTEGEVPVRVAAKLAGRTRRTSFGILDVQTGSRGELDAENLFIGRVSQDVFEQSDLGVLWTHGDPAAARPAADRNDTYGADFNYRTDRFLGHRSLRGSAYVLRSRAEEGGNDGLAYHGSLDYPNDVIDLKAEATVVSEDFDPALGFVRRRGVAKYLVDAAWQPRPGSEVRQYEFRVRPTLIENSDGETETVELLLRPLGIEWESGERLRLDVVHSREVLDADFDISSGVTIPQAAYGFTRFGANLRTSEKRPLSAEVEVFAGEFFDGRRQDYTLELDWRANRHLILGGEYSLTDVDLPAGAFQVQVAQARINAQFSPELTWSNFLQWDDRSDVLGLNSRVWWLFGDGTDLFFVVNQGWRVDAETFAPGDAQVTVKFGTTFRL